MFDFDIKYIIRSITSLSINLISPTLTKLIIFAHELVMKVCLDGYFGHSEIQICLLFAKS